MMTDGELIDAMLGARFVLSEPGVWRKGSLAGSGGYGVAPLNPDADSWCLVGALCVATRQPATRHPAAIYLERLLKRRFGWKGSVQHWNDAQERTVVDVLGLLDTALEELKTGREGAEIDADT